MKRTKKPGSLTAQKIALLLVLCLVFSAIVVACNLNGNNNNLNGPDENGPPPVLRPIGAESGYLVDFRTVSLTPGRNPTQRGVTWWTETANTNPRVQLVRADQLVNGEMPANPTEFRGTSRTVLLTRGWQTNMATITGLTAGTEYAYRVNDGDEWSEIFKFRTTPTTPGNAHSVIVVGDPQIENRVSGLAPAPDRTLLHHPYFVYELWYRALGQATTREPNASFMMIAGDHVEHGGSTPKTVYQSIRSWHQFFAHPVLKSLPVMSTVGNHDENNPHLRHHFNWPNSGFAPSAGGTAWYFSYGDVLYISFNSNTSSGNAYSEHRRLLEAATRSHPDARWRIGMMHHAMFGSYRQNVNLPNSTDIRLRRELVPLIEEFGIDVFIAAHDHSYTRSYFLSGVDPVTNQAVNVFMMYSDENRPQTVPNPGTFTNPPGVLFLTIDTASGQKYYAFPRTRDPWAAYRRDDIRMPQFSIMDIDGDTLSFRTYIYRYRLGTIELLDSISIRKTNQHPPATDTTALSSLVSQVEAYIAGAVEGFRAGQFPVGSIVIVENALEMANRVLGNALATQFHVNEAVSILQEVFADFQASRHVTDQPEPDPPPAPGSFVLFEPGSIHVLNPSATPVSGTVERDGRPAFFVENAKSTQEGGRSYELEFRLPAGQSVNAAPYYFFVFEMMATTTALLTNITGNHFPRLQQGGTFVQHMSSTTGIRTARANEWITVVVDIKAPPHASSSVIGTLPTWGEQEAAIRNLQRSLNIIRLRFITSNTNQIPGRMYFRNFRFQNDDAPLPR